MFAEAAPEAPFVEVLEGDVAVELGGLRVDGVHDDGSGAELATVVRAEGSG